MTHSCRPQANYKILAARIQNDIYLLTMRLRHTTLRAEFEQTVSALTGVEGAALQGLQGLDTVLETKYFVLLMTGNHQMDLRHTPLAFHVRTAWKAVILIKRE